MRINNITPCTPSIEFIAVVDSDGTTTLFNKEEAQQPMGDPSFRRLIHSAEALSPELKLVLIRRLEKQ